MSCGDFTDIIIVMNIGIRERASVISRNIISIVCATGPSMPVFLTFIFTFNLVSATIFHHSFRNYPIAF